VNEEDWYEELQQSGATAHGTEDAFRHRLGMMSLTYYGNTTSYILVWVNIYLCVCVYI